MKKLYGNIWIFEVKLKKGIRSKRHAHEFAHIHQVVKGSSIMRLWNKDKELVVEIPVKAGEYFKVPAMHYHQIEAVEEYQGNCIHAFRTKDGTVVDNDFSLDEELLYSPDTDIQEID
jgi:cupin superfamily acireductone dioxygenase involved in methionine salvage